MDEASMDLDFVLDLDQILSPTSTQSYQRLLSFNPDSENDSMQASEDKRKTPQPVRSLTPINCLDGAFIMKEKMTQALRYFKDSNEHHVLAQVWAPVKNGGRYVLSTLGHPFVLDPNSILHRYRMVSVMYNFSVDAKIDGFLGIPGRVFHQKLPEWTPNVQYYSSKEYPRLMHALNYNVQGTLAIPIFENSGKLCIGVLELIMTNQKINYAPEVDKVCKALEAVNLKSSEILDQSNIQMCNEGRQDALVEILEILTVVCETHSLPLAQTWVPCRHGSVLAYGGGLKESCSSIDGSCRGQVCMSTTDVAFYVVDGRMWGFHEACAEHHLQKGQGVSGRAFELGNACFCADISQFCKTEYPLVHYARMFGLTSCFAICLRSSHTGDDDYVLEFFLPPSITEMGDGENLLDSLLVTMKPHLKSLRSASGKELDLEWRSMEIISASRDDELELSPKSIPETKNTGKKREKKCVMVEKGIDLEVLQQYFAGSLKDAAKSLGVGLTTMKRICRQHGISRWPSRKINKVNRSLSKLKCVLDSVPGTEGTFTLNSLASSSLPVDVNFKPGSSSREEGAGNLNSRPSHVNLSSPTNNLVDEQYFRVGDSMEFLCQPTGEINLSDVFLTLDDFDSSHALEPFHSTPVEDVGNSHDLINLSAAGEGMSDERQQEYSRTNTQCSNTVLKDNKDGPPNKNPSLSARPETETITIKATYKENIIRFRLPLECGIDILREEMARRLKFELATSEIKYLDDDHEWVLIACDADLQECIDLSRSSGCNIIRLLVHDISTNLGSS